MLDEKSKVQFPNGRKRNPPTAAALQENPISSFRIRRLDGRRRAAGEEEGGNADEYPHPPLGKHIFFLTKVRQKAILGHRFSR
jgi:hypothetical protein